MIKYEEDDDDEEVGILDRVWINIFFIIIK